MTEPKLTYRMDEATVNPDGSYRMRQERRWDNGSASTVIVYRVAITPRPVIEEAAPFDLTSLCMAQPWTEDTP